MGIWSTIKTVVTPSLFGLTRTVSSAGSSLFGVLNVFKYFHLENHSTEEPASYFSIGVNAATTVTTTVPYLFRQFRNQNKSSNETADKFKEATLPFYSCCQCSKPCNCHETKSFKSQAAETILDGIGLTSGAFISLGFYLGAVTLCEFIRKRLYESSAPLEEWETWEISLTLAFATLCAFGNYMTFYSNRYQKIKTSAKNVADILEHSGSIWNAEAAKALGLSLPNLISGPFMSYFSISNALTKIPFVHVPDILQKTLPIISASTSIPTTLLTDIPALYDYFKKRKTDTDKPQYIEPAWEPFARASIYFIGAVDAIISVGLNSFVSMVSTSKDVFGIDPYSWKIIVPSIICSASKTANGFFFYVYRGYNDTLADYHEQRGDIPYSAIEKNTDAGSTVSELIKSSQCNSTLFTKPPTETKVTETSPLIKTDNTPIDKKIPQPNYATFKQ